jgi:predicted nucleic acid-binding protein
VCTRPADKNGLGLTPIETERQLNQLESILTLLHDSPAVYEQWRKLIAQYEVKGIQVHDARMAAAMQVHGIDRILTYNPRDFGRYDGIQPVCPDEVIL